MSDSLDATPDASGSTSNESLDDNETLDPSEFAGTEHELSNEPELTDDEPEEKPEPKTKPEPKKEKPKPESKEPKDSKPRTPKELGDADLDDLVTVKVNGETKKMTVREVMKVQSLEQASQRRMQEAAEERRKAASLVHLAMTERQKFYELAGVKDEDLDREAEERLARKYELSQMSDEERELHQLRAERTKSEQADLQSKRAVLQAIRDEAGEEVPEEFNKLSKERLERVLERVKADNVAQQKGLDEEIGSAWRDSGLPKHPRFVQLIAQTMRNSLAKGRTPLQANEAAAIVKKDFAIHVKEIVEQLDAKAIQEMFGDDVMKKLRRHDVDRVSGRAPSSNDVQKPRPGTPPASQKTLKSKEMNLVEYRAYMAELKNALHD